jgi:hypothetical protein
MCRAFSSAQSVVVYDAFSINTKITFDERELGEMKRPPVMAERADEYVTCQSHLARSFSTNMNNHI